MGGSVGNFIGTAGFYARYRPLYPEEVWDLLIGEAQLGEASSILDLGCGPGTATLPLARRVALVTAVDAEMEMLDEGRTAATDAGISNVHWVHSTAETFDGEAGAYQAAVIASAFHWMDRPAVVARCHDLVADGGLLAIVGNPTPLIQIRQRAGVGEAIAEVQERWFGDDNLPLRTEELARPEEILRASPFVSAEVRYLPCLQEWDVERLIGFLRSTSFRLDQRLGDRVTTFAREIEDAVLGVQPSGRWSFESSIEIVLARKANTDQANTSP